MSNEQRIYDRCIVRVGQLEAENEELRELVKDMWDWLAPTAESGTPLNELYDRMHNFGIEVD